MLKALVIITTTLMFSAAQAQDVHGHLNVGAQSTQQGTPLLWENGADFIGNYVKTFTFTNSGRFAGFYQGNITLTVLPATEAHAGPDPLAPALGSVIQFKMACLSGPAGGAFSFWDVGTVAPSISLTPGQRSEQLFRLTESEGNPGDDPYGHFHGRRFTATKPGMYKIGFIAVDTSVNGAGGGAIHTPSPEIEILFQAGITIASVTRTGTASAVTFGAVLNQSYVLEFTETLQNPQWTQVAGPVAGSDSLTTLSHNSGAAQGFYRIKVVTP